MTSRAPIDPETPVTVRLVGENVNVKFSLPMWTMTHGILSSKIEERLVLPSGQHYTLERYSDTVGAYMPLDSADIQAYKTLFRAAKAKLKIRLRISFSVAQQDDAAAKDEVVSGNRQEDAAPVVEKLGLDRQGAGKEDEQPKTEEAAAIPPLSVASPVKPAVLSTARSATVNDEADEADPSDVQEHSLSERIRQLQLPPDQASKEKCNGQAKRPMRKIPSEAEMRRREEAWAKLCAYRTLDPNKHGAPGKRPASEDESSRINAPCSATVLPDRGTSVALPASDCTWAVYCNTCDKSLTDTHYHCALCDGGNYDLCETCVGAGIHCPGENHWLIRRYFKDYVLVASETDRVGYKNPSDSASVQPTAPTLPSDAKVSMKTKQDMPSRTCNCCVRIVPEYDCVTCTSCDDYDLCLYCHILNAHGHHPGHAFQPTGSFRQIGPLAEELCQAGRNFRHAADCDGCDKTIYGVRHKCVDCPDWDYCSHCVQNAAYIHPGHRLVPVYSGIADDYSVSVVHHGVLCDGPHCSDKTGYIKGARYKCAVCVDADFCATCEASPVATHDPAHPLVKLRMPLRHLTISVFDKAVESAPHVTPLYSGFPIREMADSVMDTTNGPVAPAAPAAPVIPTVSALPSYVTVSSIAAAAVTEAGAAAVADLMSAPIEEKVAEPGLVASPIQVADFPSLKAHVDSAFPQLIAVYIHQTVSLNTCVTPGETFSQTWTLLNFGQRSWPAGCRLQFQRGDSMLCINDQRPVSSREIEQAMSSNVINHEVSTGQKASFSMTFRAPRQTGYACGYWRVTAGDGSASFGDFLTNAVTVIPGNNTVTVKSQEKSAPSSSKCTVSGEDAAELAETTKTARLAGDSAYTIASAAETSTTMGPNGAVASVEVKSHFEMLKAQLEAIQALATSKPAFVPAAVDALGRTVGQQGGEHAKALRKALLTLRDQPGASATSTTESPSETPAPQAAKPAGDGKDIAVVFPRPEGKEITSNAAEEAGAAGAALKPEKGNVSAERVVRMFGKGMELRSTVVKKEELKAVAVAVVVAETAKTAETVETAKTAENPNDGENDDDVESIDLADDESDEEGFLTDEEYDILGASDQEVS